MMKSIKSLEALGARKVMGTFANTSPERASDLGGRIARSLGPHLPISRRVRQNLTLAMPNLARPDRDSIVRRVWDNAGRIVGELPHLRTIADPANGYLELCGVDLYRRLASGDRPLVVFSGHLANFELFGQTARHLGHPLALFYRPMNNPGVEALHRNFRGHEVEYLPKGRRGLRRSIGILREGGCIGLLIDQKANEGIPVPFFGRDAMTTPILPELALQYGARMAIGRAERLDPARYRLSIEELDTGNLPTDRREAAREILIRINRRLEDWIRERPGEWFWMHRRWPD